MRRTKQPKNWNRLQALEQLSGSIVSRANLAARLGYQYSGDRDIYAALGYKKDLDYTDYATQYTRQDIAKAVINRPVGVTWRGPLKVVQTDVPESEFEKTWDELNKKLKLKSKFIRLDKLSLIGKYGVLLLGLDDVTNKDMWRNPVTPGKRTLKYVKPLGEGSADVLLWDTQSSSERYGKPTVYNIEIRHPDSGSSTTLQVHHSRIIHVTGELLESEVDGVPYLEAIFNRLKDLEKIVGASAEMFWRGARPGYHGTVNPEFDMSPDDRAELETQIEEYENDLRRFLINDGVEIKEMATQVQDPSKHVDILIQMISAEKGIPKRILTGSERGELSSSQDKDNWLEYIQSRREERAEPQLIEPFVEKCMELGILPKVNEYSIIWQDLFASSDLQKAEVAKQIAEAIKSYTTNPMAEAVIPPKAFLKLMNLDDDIMEIIETELAELSLEEVELDRQRQRDINENGEE